MQRYWFILLYALLDTMHTSAQGPAADWLPKNDQGNRYEGSYARKVSNPAIELVSFTAGSIEPYKKGQKQQLRVKFCLAGDSVYLLKAEELRPVQYYWMQGKNTSGDTGWNVFDQWPVDAWLGRLDVPADNLGVLVRIGTAKSARIAPALVYHSKAPTAIAQYVAKFRLGNSISEGRVDVYRGQYERETPPAAQKIHAATLNNKSGGSYFPVLIRAELLGNTAGWFTVRMELTKAGNTQKIPYSFCFYHQPDL